MSENTAANQGGQAAAGQAAGSQQGGQQQGATGVQGDQGQQGQGSQGNQGASAQQTGGQQGGQQGTQQGTQQGAQASQGGPQSGQPQTADEGPPERYELRLPDRTPLDQSDLESVAAIARAKGWTNEQAQAALEEMGTSLAEQTTRFRHELDADPEVGGAHLEQAQVWAKRALDRFLPEGSPQGQRFRMAMNKSGYGNFLPLVTLLARIGKAMSEDQPGAGSMARVFSNPQRSQAERLFGDAQGVKPPT
jgi:hypothetical protein